MANSESLRYALGATYERAGDWRRGVEVARSLLAQNPRSVRAMNFIAYTSCDRGLADQTGNNPGNRIPGATALFEEAERLLRQALVLQPRNGYVTDSLGWCYFKIGRLDEAERTLLAADRLAPGEADILRHLGDVYSRKGERARALEQYRRALRNRPDDKLRQEIEHLVQSLEAERAAGVR
jgi:tetratricopeptide (TPR) repeat protein